MTNPSPKVSNPNRWPPSKILATFEDGQGFIEGGQTTEVDTFGIPPTKTQHQQTRGENNDRSFTILRSQEGGRIENRRKDRRNLMGLGVRA